MGRVHGREAVFSRSCARSAARARLTLPQRSVLRSLHCSPSDKMPIMNTFCEDENAPAFPLGKAELIEKMKRLTETSFGTDKPENNDLLADDFQFRFPIVELDKPKFIKAFGAFKVDDAFPDMQTQYYGFRLDPNIPGRLWYDQIGEGRPFKLSWQFRFFALIGQATDTLKAAYAQYQAGGVSGVVTYTRELVASVLPASFAKLLKTA